jgi:hypothetical protein
LIAISFKTKYFPFAVFRLHSIPFIKMPTFRELWVRLLHACCAGADISEDGHPLLRIAAALAVFPGRPEHPRSLGSVLGATVARFLPHAFLGVCQGTQSALWMAGCRKLVYCRDGETALVATDTHIDVFRVASDTRSFELVRTVGGAGAGPLRFRCINGVFVDEDGAVFVVDTHHAGIVKLTSTLQYDRILGTPSLDYPTGCCVDATRVFVAEPQRHHVAVLDKRTGILRFCLGDRTTMCEPRDVCFVEFRKARCLAVACNFLVVIVDITDCLGAILCNVRVGRSEPLDSAYAIACTDANELLIGTRKHLYVLRVDRSLTPEALRFPEMSLPRASVRRDGVVTVCHYGGHAFHTYV